MVVPSTTNNTNQQDNLVYDHKISSVGSALVTGELTYEPSNMDLAMKLHYLRVVYFLDSQAIEGLTPKKLKEGIFTWFNYYYESCGRFRRYENGRPYIKCNDCGARFVEAKSSLTLEEWIQMEDTSSQRLLIADNVLGPELTFSPLIFLQITSLKCGGLAFGLSWAHVLGDAFSASDFMNTLAQILSGKKPTYPPNYDKSPPQIMNHTKPLTSDPISLKKVGPVGDQWINPSPCELDTMSFLVSSKQMAQLQAKLTKKKLTPSPIQPFELISSVIWHAIARIKNGLMSNSVIIIKKDEKSPTKDATTLRNNQFVGSVKAEFPVEEAHLEDLVALINDMTNDERIQIGEMVGQDPGGFDCIVYGSNLTFINWSEVGLYGFELNGIRPKFVYCFVDGIGEEGVVIILPSSKGIANEERVVTLSLPKIYMVELKEHLEAWGLIA